MGAGSRPGKVRLQHLFRQRRPRADDELRPPLGDRPERVAPLRREPEIDRSGDEGCLRAVAPPLGGRSHRLPAGPERHPALRRCPAADHADPRSDALGLLPRHRPQEDDARAPPRPRPDPGRGPQRAPRQVPRVRHRVCRRADRQAGDRQGFRQDRDAPRPAPRTTALRRAARDLRAQAGGLRKNAAPR